MMMNKRLIRQPVKVKNILQAMLFYNGAALRQISE